MLFYFLPFMAVCFNLSPLHRDFLSERGISMPIMTAGNTSLLFLIKDSP